jgi:chemotaxis signal transduction protein
MTKTMVRFRSGGATYVVPVESTLGVRAADGIVPLPEPRPDVVGVLPGHPPLTVLAGLGAGRAHVLVLTTESGQYGLFVDEVFGLSRVDEARIGPAPAGQDRSLVSGMVEDAGELVLVADPVALAARL